jgi:hypothetical protein
MRPTSLDTSPIFDEIFELEIGGMEQSKLEFSRNWFTGAMERLFDGRGTVVSARL